MPAALNVDREAARTLCVAVGVREAARQMGVPENTMLAWSNRGQWTAKLNQAQDKAKAAIAARPSNASAITVQSNAIKPADALAESLADDSKATRIGLSQASRRAVEHLRTSSGSQILKSAKQMKEVASVASIVHGWQDGKSTNVQINLAIGIGGVE